MITMMRYALVASDAPAITAYLPSNYRILGTVDGQTVIAGRDQAGWTLEGYVIPRLASGLYFATEIDLSHPALKQLPG
jgi:hypothetical protein